MMTQGKVSARYRVLGMDCSSDAAEIERAVTEANSQNGVRVSVATQIMTLATADEAESVKARRAVEALGYGLSQVSEDTQSHITPSYKRALWAVALLNLGYGVLEMIGGFLSGSQAVKADALDFLGDGAITLLGLVAIGWSLAWRARSALLQGGFLGVMGIGVLANTILGVLSQRPPEAELMGVFGMIALAVNVGAALLLIPHRTGDSGVRAVWLFSRNDAIGNAAVVVASVLVGYTGSAWPDLIVAFAIAALFLQSSWSIVRDARKDLSAVL